MQIELEVNGEDRIFVAPSVKARMLRNALAIKNKIDFSDIEEKELDELVNFVCDAFGNQFTVDQCYDGVKIEDFMPLITEVMNKASGASASATAASVEDQDNKKK